MSIGYGRSSDSMDFGIRIPWVAPRSRPFSLCLPRNLLKFPKTAICSACSFRQRRLFGKMPNEYNRPGAVIDGFSRKQTSRLAQTRWPKNCAPVSFFVNHISREMCKKSYLFLDCRISFVSVRLCIDGPTGPSINCLASHYGS